MWSQFHTWISNRDNVTFVIAIAGFALSIWNFAENKLKNRKNLNVTVRNVFCLGSDETGYSEVLNITIVNRSREAITISDMDVTYNGRKNRFGEYRKSLLLNKNIVGTKETRRAEWFSDTLPVKIEGLGYVHLLLVSSGDGRCIREGCPAKMCLHTNKGRVTRIFVNDFSNLILLSQCREPNSEVQELE